MATFSNVIAFDDAPFESRAPRRLLLVGTICARTRLDGVVSTRIRRDGSDSTRKMIAAIEASQFGATSRRFSFKASPSADSTSSTSTPCTRIWKSPSSSSRGGAPISRG
jgi:hypothetical protein